LSPFFSDVIKKQRIFVLFTFFRSERRNTFVSHPLIPLKEEESDSPIQRSRAKSNQPNQPIVKKTIQIQAEQKKRTSATFLQKGSERILSGKLVGSKSSGSRRRKKASNVF